MHHDDCYLNKDGWGGRDDESITAAFQKGLYYHIPFQMQTNLQTAAERRKVHMKENPLHKS